MHWNNHRPSCILRMLEHVMAADNPVGRQTPLCSMPGQPLYPLRPAAARYSSYAATVTRRISGCASAGMGIPLSRRYSRIARIASSALASASCSVSPSVTTSGSAGTSTVKPPSSWGSRITEKLYLSVTILLPVFLLLCRRALLHQLLAGDALQVLEEDLITVGLRELQRFENLQRQAGIHRPVLGIERAIGGEHDLVDGIELHAAFGRRHRAESRRVGVEILLEIVERTFFEAFPQRDIVIVG